MSSAAVAKNVKTRRLVVRCALIGVYIGLTAIVFVGGKGHTIIIDNKDSDDGLYKAFDDVRVGVDSQADSDYMAGDRGMAVVQGQTHRVIIDKGDGSAKIEKTVHLPLGQDSVLVSLPRLVADARPYMQPFAMSVPADIEQSEIKNENAAAEAPGTAGQTGQSTAESSAAGSGAAASGGAVSSDTGESGDAVFYSQPGGQGEASGGSTKESSGSSDSSDSDDTVFYSQPGGEGTASP